MLKRSIFFLTLLIGSSAMAAPNASNQCMPVVPACDYDNGSGTGWVVDDTLGGAGQGDLYYVKQGTDWIKITCSSTTCTITSATADTFSFASDGVLAAALSVTGDATFSGGAGAMTCGNGDCSLLLTDNDSTSFLIGSTGLLDALTFSTADGAEKITAKAELTPSKSFTIDAESLATTTSLQLAQSDFTAYDSTAATFNYVQLAEYTLGAMMVVDGGNTVPTLDASGLDITAGNVTDNDHVSYWSNFGPGVTGKPFVAQTDAAFQFCVDMTVTDVTGTDFHYCGFRTPAPVTVSMASYTDYCAIGHVSGNYGTHDKTTGATDSGNDVIADTEEDTWCTKVSAAGVCTYTIDGVAVESADTHTLAAGTLVIPFCELRHDADGAEDTIIGKWAVTYQ